MISCFYICNSLDKQTENSGVLLNWQVRKQLKKKASNISCQGDKINS